ncbi:protein-methionine-sulfoxide reductase catalytic subunit MsrP [soil metagenome]
MKDARLLSIKRRRELGDAIAESQVTAQSVFETRRRLLGVAATTAIGSIGGFASSQVGAADLAKLPGKVSSLSLMDKPTPFTDATTYNNYYEFGTGKADPARNAGKLRTRPWTVTIEGAVGKPGQYRIEDLLSLAAMEERVYRLRCVEAWSMVIPWVGYSLAELIRKVEPTSAAKFVQFETVVQKDTMNDLNSGVLDWPYVEGLRIDEAMHPLTMLVFGMYGQVLPNQNGAPVRLVVPWKYGFKSIKSIERIRFVDKQPHTSWEQSAPGEYGFFSNVNPDVDHPRWSQASERAIPSEGGLFAPRRKTQMFNGYGAQVASMYAGLDLRKNY